MKTIKFELEIIFWICSQNGRDSTNKTLVCPAQSPAQVDSYRPPPQLMLERRMDHTLLPGASGPENNQDSLRGVHSDEARVHQTDK